MRQQNDLFRGGPNYHLNACVGINGGPYGLYDYARGYFRAGQRLAASLCEDSMWVDVLVYPLVFTYRHGIELALKHLATVLPRLRDEPSRPKLTHRLLDNWEFVRAHLAARRQFDPEGTRIDEVDRILRNLTEIDPSGEAFRFPHARTGAFFLQETSLINTDVFAAAMSRVIEALDYWDQVAENLDEYKREIETR